MSGSLGVVRIPRIFGLFECRRGVGIERSGESGIEATPSVRILFVEFGDLFWGVFAARRWFPGIIAMTITFPLDQVLEFLTVDARVENLVDFVLFFTVDDLWGWWCSLFESIITPWAKTINVYDWVDVKPCGQFNSIVEGANTFEDFERTELTGAEFGTLLMNCDVFG